MDEIKQLVEDIKNKKIKPIYFLMGEEPYYIDKLSEFIEGNVLSEEEKGFNQMVIYGRDTSIEEIVSNAKRFPMMAEFQVIIVKEAQDLSRTIEQLLDYVKNPQPSTILMRSSSVWLKPRNGRWKRARYLTSRSLLLSSRR